MSTPHARPRSPLALLAYHALLTLLRLPALLALLALLAAGLAPRPLPGQLIGLRSVPVASGDQFLVHASERLGMAGATVALDDRLLDPFVNPAKGALVEHATLLAAPTFYGISGGNGGARTLPLSALLPGDRWFGGVSLALQEVVDERGRDRFVGVDPLFFNGPARRLDETSSSNLFTHAFLGRRLGGGDVSVGVGLSWASLAAVDGVDLLYAGNRGLDQHGGVVDARVGLQGRRPDGGRWEVVALFDRLQMTHEVSSLVWVEPADEQPFVTIETREERDDTRTLGLHAGWVGAPSEEGWRTGAALTVNRKDHPKIPNYELQNIPRDPGESWAWNAAAGVSREARGVSVAADIVLEPVWSDTWAEAAEPVQTQEGDVIEAGGKTVENEFFFTNAHVRLGLMVERARWDVQAGVAVSRYAYDLEQVDHVAGTVREQDEGWVEWTPTWGGSLALGDFRLRYTGRVTTGTGQPGVEWPALPELATAADVIVAPSGPLTLQEAHVWTHQVALSVPLN